MQYEDFIPERYGFIAIDEGHVAVGEAYPVGTVQVYDDGGIFLGEVAGAAFPALLADIADTSQSLTGDLIRQFVGDCPHTGFRY
jgi:hypothetical protein